MRLTIIRHGKAEKDSPTGRDDDRPLTPRGHRQAEHLAHALADPAYVPDLILSSGLARAIATARLIGPPLDRPVQLEPLLETGHGVSDALRVVEQHRDIPAIALVGHNPTLAELVSTLTHGLPPYEAELRTGEAVVLDLPDGGDHVGASRLITRLRLDDSEE